MPPPHEHHVPLPPRELLRLARLTSELGDDLKRLAATSVSDARAGGASWVEVGEAFGVTRQSAHQKFRTPSNPAEPEPVSQR